MIVRRGREEVVEPKKEEEEEMGHVRMALPSQVQ
jgi:hypothetical protein